MSSHTTDRGRHIRDEPRWHSPKSGRPAAFLDGETVWATQSQMAELFGTTQQNVSLHLQNAIDEGELDYEATHKDFLSVRREGTRNVRRTLTHYDLDAIVSVGYRVHSPRGVHFRRWATGILRQQIQARPQRTKSSSTRPPSSSRRRDAMPAAALPSRS
jgi:hypothetical protein